LQLLPKLSKKQLEAFKLAQKYGYWNYPKNISLTELAKLARVSKSTFHENLKKAEIKFLGSIK